MLIVGIEKRNANEYLKSTSNVYKPSKNSLDTPDLIMTIFDIAHNFVITANQSELNVAFKLLQKVLYLLQSDTINDEKINHILGNFMEIKKKLLSLNDESLCLSYLETLRKFLLAHIEKAQRPTQEKMMLTFYTQLYELYSETAKNYKTLVIFLLLNFL